METQPYRVMINGVESVLHVPCPATPLDAKALANDIVEMSKMLGKYAERPNPKKWKEMKEYKGNRKRLHSLEVENEILELLNKGIKRKEIAQQLNVKTSYVNYLKYKKR